MLSAFPPKPNKKSPAKKIKKKGENKEEVCHHGGAIGLEKVELCGRSESGEDQSGDGEGDDFGKRRIVGLKAFCFFPLSSLFFCWGFFVCI